MSDLHRTNSMSKGRIAQKRRTRMQLLAACREMISENAELTVAAVATRAGISTATAYRYFADVEELRLQAMIEAERRGVELLLTDFAEFCRSENDVIERVVQVQRMLVKFVRDFGTNYNTYLAQRLLETTGPERPRNRPAVGWERIPMLEIALDPVRGRLGAEFSRIVRTLATAVGPESFLLLRNVTMMNEGEAIAITENAARIMAEGLLAPIQPQRAQSVRPISTTLPHPAT